MFRGLGIPSSGDPAPIIYDLTSQGQLSLINPYDLWTKPQLILKDVSASSTGTHKSFGFRARNNQLMIGAWESGSDDFAAAYNGAIRLSDTGLLAQGDLVVQNAQYSGNLYFGDKVNGNYLGFQNSWTFHKGVGSNGYITPDADGNFNLGHPSYRFDNLYLSEVADTHGVLVQASYVMTLAGSTLDTTRSTLYLGYNTGIGTNIDLAAGRATVSVSTGKLTTAGGVQPPHLPDSSAANDTTYYSTTVNTLVYKDAGGTVHRLY